MKPAQKFPFNNLLVWITLVVTSISLPAEGGEFDFGNAISGTNSSYGLGVVQHGSGVAIYGTNAFYNPGGAGVLGNGIVNVGVMGTSEKNYAVYGESQTADGVYGVTKGMSRGGVIGENKGSGGYGVGGHAKDAFGVYGATSSELYAGVMGYNETRGVGVGGKAATGTGVVGEGGLHGVSGMSHSIEHAGGHFLNDHQGYGVYAITDSPLSANRSGIAGFNEGSGYAVTAFSKEGTGIAGKGLKEGVHGVATTTKTKGTGVYGLAAGSSGVGVEGSSKKGKGIQGITDTGAAVSGLAYKDKGWAGQFVGYSGASGVLIVTHGGPGLLVEGGSKSAVVPTSQGSRLLYAEEATEVHFTDYGSGRLQDGKAIIPVDPLFSETVNLAQPYHVFVQSYSDAQLVVSRRSPQEFEVRLHARDMEGDRNAEFSYRLVAKRKGFEQARLEKPPFPADAEKSVDATTPDVSEEQPLLSVSEPSDLAELTKPPGSRLPLQANALSFRSDGGGR